MASALTQELVHHPTMEVPLGMCLLSRNQAFSIIKKMSELHSGIKACLHSPNILTQDMSLLIYLSTVEIDNLFRRKLVFQGQGWRAFLYDLQHGKVFKIQ